MDKRRRMQNLQNLQRANEAKLAGAQIRKELKCGLISLEDALEDDRAQSLAANLLLCAMPQWGPVRSDSVLMSVGIWPSKRVRDLSDDQRWMLDEAVAR